MQPRLDQARACAGRGRAPPGRRRRRVRASARSRRPAPRWPARRAPSQTERREFERVDDAGRAQAARAPRIATRPARGATRPLAARDQARARLRLLQEGTRPEQVREAEAAVAARRAPRSPNSRPARRAMKCARRGRGWIEALPYKLGERPAGRRAGRRDARGGHARTRASTCPSRSARSVTAGRRVAVTDRRRRGRARTAPCATSPPRRPTRRTTR